MGYFAKMCVGCGNMVHKKEAKTVEKYDFRDYCTGIEYYCHSCAPPYVMHRWGKYGEEYYQLVRVTRDGELANFFGITISLTDLPFLPYKLSFIEKEDESKA